MKMKKTLTAAVAMVLVAAVSVAGTLAYLSAKTEVITNTFTAGNLGENAGIELWETKVEQQTDGHYAFKADGEKVMAGEGNAYNNLLPGSTNDKNPTVTVKNLSTDAYVFIEVVNDDADDILADVDTNNWTLMDVKPTADNSDAKVYCVATNDGIVHASELQAGSKDITVLKENKFKVENYDNNHEASMKNITVKAYMCQATGFVSAADAWAKAFAPQTAPTV